MDKVLLLWFCSIICGVLTIDVDYYLGVMRSMDCFGPDGDCSYHCKSGLSVCHKGQCYCHYDLLNGDMEDGSKKNVDARPVLRHHIAHFCPNLDIARQCIRKCMTMGKPAFCGKDHRCYCGHQYDSHSKDVAANAKATYADFKDLYEKYFDVDARPVLRHHIAHFCPNLDIARQCIRKCMTMGKPAFCGKDHRCYCGHQYDSHSKDVAANAKATYADFKDLYEKYFGKQRLAQDRIVEAD